MPEYIDRDTLYSKISELEALARNRVACTPATSPEYMRYVSRLNDIIAIKHTISDAPAAEVVPVVHGRWILDGSDEYADHYHCDQCGAEIDLCNELYTEPTPNYCKDCGSKMDEEATDFTPYDHCCEEWEER